MICQNFAIPAYRLWCAFVQPRWKDFCAFSVSAAELHLNLCRLRRVEHPVEVGLSYTDKSDFVWLLVRNVAMVHVGRLYSQGIFISI